MNIEKTIENCEIYLKQIKQYEPDPFYVNYFFVTTAFFVSHIFTGFG